MGQKNLAKLIQYHTATKPWPNLDAFVAGYGVGLATLRLVVFSFAGGHVYRRCGARCHGDGDVCIGWWTGTDRGAMVVVALGQSQAVESSAVA